MNEMKYANPRHLGVLLAAAALMQAFACQTSVSLVDPLPPGGTDTNSQKPGPTPTDPENPPPAPIQINPTGDYMQYVLTDRQRFIGLPAWMPGVDYNTVTFAILAAPTHGTLYGSAPNLVYVPDAGFSGDDEFIYHAAGGSQSLQRRVKLKVAPTFVPPIGIPAPPFGIEESHHMYDGATFDFGSGPEPYRDAGNGPYTHYVDCNIGQDSFPPYNDPNPFGTAALPRKTIPNSLPDGSVVELHGVGFDAQLLQSISGTGSAAKPIFIRGPSPTQKPIVRRPIQVACDYVIVENIDFDYFDYGSPSLSGVGGMVRVYEETSPALRLFHHISVRHCLFRDMPRDPTEGVALATNFSVQDGPSSPNDATSLLEYLVVYDIEARNLGEWNNPSGSTDYAGPHFGANTRNVWLLDSHLHHLGGHAAGLSRTNGLPNQAPCRNGFTGRCYMHHCKESVFVFKHARDSILSQSILHTSRDSDSGSGDGVQIVSNDYNANWPASDNIWVLFNEVYDTERGIDHTSPPSMPVGTFGRSYIVGNVVHDVFSAGVPNNTNGSGISHSKLTQVRIINNTIYNCDQGIWWGTSGLTEPDRCTTVIRNNLIANLSENFLQTNGVDGQHLHMTPNSITPFSTVDHNLHWEDVGNVRFMIVAPFGVTRYFFLLPEMFVTTGLGGDSLQTPPLLSNPADNSYFLTGASPCANAGVLDDAYTTFQLSFGTSIRFYQDGTPFTPGQVHIGALPVK
jgi:hypothetical protein